MSFRSFLTIVLLSVTFACNTVAKKDITKYKYRGDVESLSKIAENGGKQQRISAIEALGQTGDPRAIGLLTKSLSAQSWVEREAAVVALGQINDFLTVEPLITALGDKEAFVRERAAKELLNVSRSMGLAKNPRIIKILLSAQYESDPFTKTYTAKALQVAVKELRKMQNPQFIDELIKAAKDDNRYVRRQAAASLGLLNNPKAIQPLIELQNDRDRQTRDIATRALREINDPRSISVLIKALANDDESIRFETITKLSEFKRPRDIETIQQALSDDNALIRAGVAEVLGRIKSPSSINPLKVALTDKNADVRFEAAKALTVLGWEMEKPRDRARMCVAAQQWQKCVELGEAAKPVLKDVLLDNDPKIRESVANALQQLNWSPTTNAEKGIDCVIDRDWELCVTIGEAALDALITELYNGDIETQADVIETLATINHTRAIQPLFDIYNRSDADAKIRIIKALGTFNHPLPLKTLISALEDNNYYVRQASAEALEKGLSKYGKDNYFDTKTPLLNALKDNNRNVRRVAAQLLGELKDPATIPALLSAIEDKDRDVRLAASSSLQEIKGSGAITPLIDALKHDNPEIRKQAVQSLATFKDHRAFEPLLQTMNDIDIDVQVTTIDAFANMDDPRTIEPLIGKLNASDLDIVTHAINALSVKSDPRVIDSLLPLQSHKQGQVRITSGQALLKLGWEPKSKSEQAHYCIIKEDWNLCESLGSDAVEPLILELQDPDSMYRVESARTLGFIGDVRAIKPLITSIELTKWSFNEYNSEIIESAKRALIKFEKDVLAEAMNYLTDWYTGEHIADVLESVGWIPHTDTQLIHFLVAKRSRPELKENWQLTKSVLLNDIAQGNEQARNNAIFAFIGLGEEEMLAQLVKTLESKGTLTLAEAYLNSNHQQLRSAALNWTSSKNLEVKEYGKGNTPIYWGAL